MSRALTTDALLTSIGQYEFGWHFETKPLEIERNKWQISNLAFSMNALNRSGYQRMNEKND